MKHKIAGLLLAAGLLSSLLTGCSKEESAAGSETQAEAAQTVYAYQASYLPLDAGEYEVSYINAMCVSGENLFEFSQKKIPIDPEITAGSATSNFYGRTAPFERIISFGVQLTM